MSLNELVEALSEKTGEPKTRVKKILLAALDTIQDRVMSGADVRFLGFGRFFRKRIPAGTTPRGRVYAARDALGFTSQIRSATFKTEVKAMEKLGVVFDDDKVKTGSDTKTCPQCGSVLTSPNQCPKCGTEPFEKRPEEVTNK